MAVIQSALSPKSDAFRANAERMEERLAEVRGLEAKVRANSAAARDKFEKRGQLLPRERVERLLGDEALDAVHRMQALTIRRVARPLMGRCIRKLSILWQSGEYF